MKLISDLFHSKKFVALLIGLLVLVLKDVVGLDAETATKLAGLVGAYLLGQGIADGVSGGMTSSMPGTPTREDVRPKG